MLNLNMYDGRSALTVPFGAADAHFKFHAVPGLTAGNHGRVGLGRRQGSNMCAYWATIVELMPEYMAEL
jgi:hypothetical protein